MTSYIQKICTTCVSCCLVLLAFAPEAHAQGGVENPVGDFFVITTITTAAVAITATTPLSTTSTMASSAQPPIRRRKRRRRRVLNLIQADPIGIHASISMGQGANLKDLAQLFEIEKSHFKIFAKVLRQNRKELGALLREKSKDINTAEKFLVIVENAMASNEVLHSDYLRIAVIQPPTKTTAAMNE